MACEPVPDLTLDFIRTGFRDPTVHILDSTMVNIPHDSRLVLNRTPGGWPESIVACTIQAEGEQPIVGVWARGSGGDTMALNPAARAYSDLGADVPVDSRMEQMRLGAVELAAPQIAQAVECLSD